MSYWDGTNWRTFRGTMQTARLGVSASRGEGDALRHAKEKLRQAQSQGDVLATKKWRAEVACLQKGWCACARARQRRRRDHLPAMKPLPGA